MPSATLAIYDHSDGLTTLTEVGETANGAIYKDATRSLSLPLSLEYQYVLGAPNSNGNDKLIIRLSNSLSDTATGTVATGQATLTVSIPRKAVWTAGYIQHLVTMAVTAFTGAVVASKTRVDAVSAGLIP